MVDYPVNLQGATGEFVAPVAAQPPTLELTPGIFNDPLTIGHEFGHYVACGPGSA